MLCPDVSPSPESELEFYPQRGAVNAISFYYLTFLGLDQRFHRLSTSLHLCFIFYLIYWQTIRHPVHSLFFSSSEHHRASWCVGIKMLLSQRLHTRPGSVAGCALWRVVLNSQTSTPQDGFTGQEGEEVQTPSGLFHCHTKPIKCTLFHSWPKVSWLSIPQKEEENGGMEKYFTGWRRELPRSLRGRITGEKFKTNKRTWGLSRDKTARCVTVGFLPGELRHFSMMFMKRCLPLSPISADKCFKPQPFLTPFSENTH